MQYRNFLNDFQAYEWEPSNYDIANDNNLKPENIVRFDTNTSPYVPSSWLTSLSEILPNIAVNNYPDSSYRSLRALIAKYNSVHEDEIIVTNGADEALDVISKVFIDPQSDVVVSSPTYSLFRIVSQIMEGNIVSVTRLNDFNDDIMGLVKASKNSNLIFLNSPNNPTGNLVTEDCINTLLDETNSFIVIDEAYFEFCDHSFKNLAIKEPRLIIVRTLSKAFSLAGARVGYIIANKSTVNLLNKVRPPNSLNMLSIALAEIALNDIDSVKSIVTKTLSDRALLYDSLKDIPKLTVFPSYGNFLLINFDVDVEYVYTSLLSDGLVLRNLSSVPELHNCLRCTVLTKDLNDLLSSSIRNLIA